MGSTVSKQGRKLSHEVVHTASTLKKSSTTILPEMKIQKKLQDTTPETKIEEKITEESESSDSFRNVSSLGVKDGHDPDFANRAMRLGMVQISETKMDLNLKNIAIRKLRSRQRVFQKGEAELESKTKSALEPSVLRALVDDQENYPPEKLTKLYELNDTFLAELGSRLKVAKRQLVESKTSKGDDEGVRRARRESENSPAKFYKNSEDLQQQHYFAPEKKVKELE